MLFSGELSNSNRFVNNITYPRHVHYTTLTEDNVWSNEIKTLVVYCHLDKEQFRKALQSKDHIIINALSEEEHEKIGKIKSVIVKNIADLIPILKKRK